MEKNYNYFIPNSSKSEPKSYKITPYHNQAHKKEIKVYSVKQPQNQMTGKKLSEIFKTNILKYFFP